MASMWSVLVVDGEVDDVDVEDVMVDELGKLEDDVDVKDVLVDDVGWTI